MDICRDYLNTLDFLRCVLTNEPLDHSENIDWNIIYDELNAHAIVPMVNLYVQKYSHNGAADEIFTQKCKEAFLACVFNTINVQREEARLCELFRQNNIYTCVLKGSAANMYYPDNILRTYGDVDILVAPDNYEKAAMLMRNEGYNQVSDLYEDPRNTIFRHGKIVIELHKSFFYNGNVATDNILYETLSTSREIKIRGETVYVLPDRENGLVLIDHIRQHIFGGLGLRQILDWYMYCLTICDDSFWYSHMNEYLQRFGLKHLAMCVAKFCKKYLGLSNITWCDDEPDETVDEFLLFIMNSGNFGKKRENEDLVIANIVSRYRTFGDRLKLLHTTGMRHWKVAQKHVILRPFAGIYQFIKI